MKAPITYLPKFIQNNLGIDPTDKLFNTFRNELEWERREGVPRSEHFASDFKDAYEYGHGKGRRIYQPKPFHPDLMDVRKSIEEYTKTIFEVCFANLYFNQSDSLGWHSDDSPEMDDAKPIAIISLGVERIILFRPIGVYHGKGINGAEPLLLENGSLCLMHAGMQDTWEHRIPRSGSQCGERISLVYRGYVRKENQ